MEFGYGLGATSRSIVWSSSPVGAIWRRSALGLQAFRFVLCIPWALYLSYVVYSKVMTVALDQLKYQLIFHSTAPVILRIISVRRSLPTLEEDFDSYT